LTVFYVLQLISFTPQPQGTYIPAFDGSSTQTKALIEAAGIIGDNPVFSTYATGLETVTGQFQPTGYDYIIHALGKEVQEEYARKFSDGEYPFAHTSSLPTESWISTQNWYFYRHLLPNYTRIFKTEYGWLWAKTESSYIDAQVDVKIEPVNSSTVKIVCTSDSTDEFVADIRITYSTGFNNIIDRLMALNRSAAVVSTGCVSGGEISTLAIPASSQEYIPVLLNNGYGEAVVRAAFGDGIDLEVSAAQFIAAMPALNYKE